MPRRCRPRSVAGPVLLGLAVAAPVALFALAPTPSKAQTPSPQSSIDLLQPSLEGNPNNPPSFVPPGNSATLPPDQAPPAGQFTAPSRIGVTPIYGSPAGFGAGDTGFDSSNARKRKRLAQMPNQGSAPAPPSEPTFEPVPAAAAASAVGASGAATAAAAGSPSGQGRVAAGRDPAVAAGSAADQQSAA